MASSALRWVSCSSSRLNFAALVFWPGFFESALADIFTFPFEGRPKMGLVEGFFVVTLFACNSFALTGLLIGEVLFAIPVTPQIIILLTQEADSRARHSTRSRRSFYSGDFTVIIGINGRV